MSGRRMGGVAVRAASVLIVVLVLGAPSPLRAEAGPQDAFDVDLAGVVNEGGPARLLVTTACGNPITGTYEAGRRAPSGGGRSDVHDARGTPASAGDDYAPVSGTFTVSESEPVVIDIPTVDDDEAEGPEHVFVVFSLREVLMTFAGDAAVCETPGPNTSHSEVAFTIEDDDPAPAPASGPGPEPSGQSSSVAAPSPAGSGGGTPGRGESGSSATPTTSGSDTLPDRDELAESEGITLVGSAATTPGPAGDNDDGIWRAGAAAAATAGVAVAAGALLWRGRRGRALPHRSGP